VSDVYKELSDESFDIEEMGDKIFVAGTGRVTKVEVAPLKATHSATTYLTHSGRRRGTRNEPVGNRRRACSAC
jgi:hypothetical protein